jgi:hypothetical protein
MSPPKAGGIFYSRGFKEEVLAPVAIRSDHHPVGKVIMPVA